MIDKKAIRAELRHRRDAHVTALDDANRLRAAEAVAVRLEAEMRKARCVAGYVALGGEFPIHAALARAASLGVSTALPVVTARNAAMRFAPWHPGAPLKAGWAGLAQPDSDMTAMPDLILTPLVGFDRELRRIGQGAGFYDRYFTDSPGARRIGIAWACQEMDAIPADPWDVPLHAIVTENEWIGPKS
ncbi:5-formyltetrahydrofolate cyclo-ligase [Sphingomonas colocasiae]|uniref:5-formyltetrahydrofolate cyclo-ligase n=1 Tax=Sphingomonas colocasiae TaxID=1848973 RepID=A0ABS7PP88_9SPHN|nr:5-formyltetrahydrofolate cyclo-ligase [Sphingomonas colocasiae]MBY8823133.1 5-formyltetrahydrofolate cyclo-ligase [Sphingomonas colocasiae]